MDFSNVALWNTTLHGNRYYSKWLGKRHPDGQEAWVRIHNGKVKSGGINKETKDNLLRFFDKDGSRKPMYRTKETPNLSNSLIFADIAVKTSK